MARKYSSFLSSNSHLIQSSTFSDDTSEHMLLSMKLKRSCEKQSMFSRLVSLRRFLNMISFRKSSCDAIRENDISIMISSSHRRTEQSSQIVSSFLHSTLTIHISTMQNMQLNMRIQIEWRKREFSSGIGSMTTDHISSSHTMQSLMSSRIHQCDESDISFEMSQGNERTNDRLQSSSDGLWLITMFSSGVLLSNTRTKWKSSLSDTESLCRELYSIKTESDGESWGISSANDFRMARVRSMIETRSMWRSHEESQASWISRLSAISTYKKSSSRHSWTSMSWKHTKKPSSKNLTRMKKLRSTKSDHERSLRKTRSKKWFDTLQTLLICSRCGAGSRLHHRKESSLLDNFHTYEKTRNHRDQDLNCLEAYSSILEARETQARQWESLMIMGFILLPSDCTLSQDRRCTQWQTSCRWAMMRPTFRSSKASTDAKEVHWALIAVQ